MHVKLLYSNSYFPIMGSKREKRRAMEGYEKILFSSPNVVECEYFHGRGLPLPRARMVCYS